MQDDHHPHHPGVGGCLAADETVFQGDVVGHDMLEDRFPLYTRSAPSAGRVNMSIRLVMLWFGTDGGVSTTKLLFNITKLGY